MVQTYRKALDAKGLEIFDEVPIPWSTNGATRKILRFEVNPGVFKPFGANGKVTSLYDSVAKAKRYCGKLGHVVELDFDDCIKVGITSEQAMVHCEARMLFWGQEADRLQKEMKKVNG